MDCHPQQPKTAVGIPKNEILAPPLPIHLFPFVPCQIKDDICASNHVAIPRWHRIHNCQSKPLFYNFNVLYLNSSSNQFRALPLSIHILSIFRSIMISHGCPCGRTHLPHSLLRLRSLSSAPYRKNKILHCVLSRSYPPPSRCLIARNRLHHAACSRAAVLTAPVLAAAVLHCAVYSPRPPPPSWRAGEGSELRVKPSCRASCSRHCRTTSFICLTIEWFDCTRKSQYLTLCMNE
jgi:hypothetical protein